MSLGLGLFFPGAPLPVVSRGELSVVFLQRLHPAVSAESLLGKKDMECGVVTPRELEPCSWEIYGSRD